MALEIDPDTRHADFAHPEHLVSASWLAAHAGTRGLAIVESDADGYQYDLGHIPTAIRIHPQSELADPLRREILSPEDFAQLMKDKGIAPEDTVVLYGDNANVWACYTAWVMRQYGHRDVRILDGGRDAWAGEERELVFSFPIAKQVSYPVPHSSSLSKRIGVTQLRDGLGTFQLVDVRSPGLFSGAEASGAARDGHIPGAINVPWKSSLQPSGRFSDVATTRVAYTDLDPAAPTVVYCNSGAQASHTAFILESLLGFSDVRVYDGSWTEWGNMIGLPIERSDAS